jgi:Tol biopolymer transport system component
LVFAMPAHATFPGANGKIAFTSDRDERPCTPGIPACFPGREIYVMNPDGSGATNVTRNIYRDDSPDWSPDGTKILFSTWRPFGGSTIYLMNADGSGLTSLNPTTFTLYDEHPSWAPDATQLAFEGYTNESNYYEIQKMNVDGSGRLRLTFTDTFDERSDFPSWSPDGTRIAYQKGFFGGDGEIYTMSANGGEREAPTNLTANSADDQAPVSWSPDGAKIAFSSNRDGNPEIYVMNADGSGQTRLTNSPAADFEPAWSPDGTKIAFTTTRDGNYEIYTMNRDGSSPTRLTTDPATDRQPSWQAVPVPPGPQRSHYKNAAHFCKAERDYLGDEPFRQKYATNKNGSNAHGKCVSQNQ